LTAVAAPSRSGSARLPARHCAPTTNNAGLPRRPTVARPDALLVAACPAADECASPAPARSDRATAARADSHQPSRRRRRLRSRRGPECSEIRRKRAVTGLKWSLPVLRRSPCSLFPSLVSCDDMRRIAQRVEFGDGARSGGNAVRAAGSVLLPGPPSTGGGGSGSGEERSAHGVRLLAGIA